MIGSMRILSSRRTDSFIGPADLQGAAGPTSLILLDPDNDMYYIW